MKTDILKKVATILFTLFVFSGLFKWLKIWPIDPTVLFGGLTIGTVVLINLVKRKKKYFKNELIYLKVFLFFSIWFYASMLYSASPSYKYTKATNFILIIISFIVPYFTIQSKRDIKFYLYSFSSVGLMISFVIFYLYIVGGNNLYYTYFKLLEYGNPLGVPDYLALGGPIGVTTIVFLGMENKLIKLLGVFSFLCLILLSGRGPVLAVFIAGIVIFLSNFRFTKRFLKTTVVSIIFIICSSSYIMKWDGFERLSSRIEHIGKGDGSITGRVDQLVFAKEMILKYPITGIGLGAFGVELFGIDMRAYPHNLLMEILVEQGLIGLFLFLLLFLPFIIYKVRYLLQSHDALFYLLGGLFVYELINALKSSSITEHRFFFALIGVCIVSYKFMKPIKSLQTA